MSDPDEAENEAAAAEVPKKVATVKKKKTPAKKKPAAPVVAVAQGVTASDEADEVPPPAPPPPKKAPKGKGKTPGKKAPPPSPRTPPPPPPPIITSDDANEPPPPSPAPKKTKKVPSSSNEAAVAAAAAEEGVEGGEVEKAHPKKTPAKKATTTTTTATTTPQVEKRPAPKTPLAKKTTNSNDTGQSPIQQSDGTATLTAGNAAQQPQQLLTVDNAQMTATLKRRGIVLKKPLHQGRHSVIYRAEMSSGPVPGTPTTTATTPVAVRVLFLDKIKQRDAIRLRQKFLPREIAALCSVHHDGLVTVHEVVRTGARVAIVMELLRDGTLTDYLTENGPFPTEAGAAPWFIEVTRALEYLHEECRLAHRNVKTVTSRFLGS